MDTRVLLLGPYPILPLSYTQSKPWRSVSAQVGGNSAGQTTITNKSSSREKDPSENTNKNNVSVTGLVVYSSSTVFHHIRGRWRQRLCWERENSGRRSSQIAGSPPFPSRILPRTFYGELQYFAVTYWTLTFSMFKHGLLRRWLDTD